VKIGPVEEEEEEEEGDEEFICHVTKQ